MARVETEIAHFRTAIDAVESRVDALRDHVDALRTHINSRLDAIKDSLASAKIWALLIAAALLGVMGRGFGWL